MPGLVPGIHVLPVLAQRDLDSRDKPGHDGCAAHTNAFPPAKARAVASSLASAGRSISLCALPDGIIGKQFSSAATRQSNSTGFFTLIISLIAPSRSPGLIT